MGVRGNNIKKTEFDLYSIKLSIIYKLIIIFMIYSYIMKYTGEPHLYNKKPYLSQDL